MRSKCSTQDAKLKNGWPIVSKMRSAPACPTSMSRRSCSPHGCRHCRIFHEAHVQQGEKNPHHQHSLPHYLQHRSPELLQQRGAYMVHDYSEANSSLHVLRIFPQIILMNFCMICPPPHTWQVCTHERELKMRKGHLVAAGPPFPGRDHQYLKARPHIAAGALPLSKIYVSQKSKAAPSKTPHVW